MNIAYASAKNYVSRFGNSLMAKWCIKKGMTKRITSSSYLIDYSCCSGGTVHSPLWQTMDDLHKKIPFKRNIPASSACGVNNSQMYDMPEHAPHSERNATFQQASEPKICHWTLESSLRKFYSGSRDPIKQKEILFSPMLRNILEHNHLQRHPRGMQRYPNSWPCHWTTLYRIPRGFQT